MCYTLNIIFQSSCSPMYALPFLCQSHIVISIHLKVETRFAMVLCRQWYHRDINSILKGFISSSSLEPSWLWNKDSMPSSMGLLPRACIHINFLLTSTYFETYNSSLITNSRLFWYSKWNYYCNHENYNYTKIRKKKWKSLRAFVHPSVGCTCKYD